MDSDVCHDLEFDTELDLHSQMRRARLKAHEVLQCHKKQPSQSLARRFFPKNNTFPVAETRAKSV